LSSIQSSIQYCGFVTFLLQEHPAAVPVCVCVEARRGVSVASVDSDDGFAYARAHDPEAI
jgi:hypothetical protein